MALLGQPQLRGAVRRERAEAQRVQGDNYAIVLRVCMEDRSTTAADRQIVYGGLMLQGHGRYVDDLLESNERDAAQLSKLQCLVQRN